MSLLSRLFSGLTRSPNRAGGTATMPRAGASARAGFFGRLAPSPPTPSRQGRTGPSTMDPAAYIAEVERDIAGRQQDDGFRWEDPSTWSHPPTPVASSNLAEVAYDDLRYVMQIRFVKAGRNNGDTYRYVAVPPHVYYGLMNAPSKGRYHHQYIRCVYSYSDISGISALQGCGTAPDIGVGLPLAAKRRR